jgi:uncharacterized membrane protein
MNNMMIYKSKWNDKETFRMIPLTMECPYNEIIFDPEQKVLAIISKDRKEKPLMLPRLSDKGDIIPAKRPNTDHTWQEQRVMMESYYEYYLENMADIESFVKHFAVNSFVPDYVKEMLK